MVAGGWVAGWLAPGGGWAAVGQDSSIVDIIPYASFSLFVVSGGRDCIFGQGGRW